METLLWWTSLSKCLLAASWQHTKEVGELQRLHRYASVSLPKLHTTPLSEDPYGELSPPSWVNEHTDGMLLIVFSSPTHTHFQLAINKPFTVWAQGYVTALMWVYWLIGSDNLYNIICLHNIGAPPSPYRAEKL